MARIVFIGIVPKQRVPGGWRLDTFSASDWPFPSRFRHQRPLFSCPTPNAPRFTSHMARPTIVGAGPAVDAPRRSGYSTPHSAGTNMLRDATFSGFFQSLPRHVFVAN